MKSCKNWYLGIFPQYMCHISTHSPTLAPKGRIHAELTWNTPPERTDRPPARGVRGQRRERARHRRHSAQRALFLRTRLSRTVLCDLGLNAPTPMTAREPEHRHRSNVVLRSRSGAGGRPRAVSDLGAGTRPSAFSIGPVPTPRTQAGRFA